MNADLPDDIFDEMAREPTRQIQYSDGSWSREMVREPAVAAPTIEDVLAEHRTKIADAIIDAALDDPYSTGIALRYADAAIAVVAQALRQAGAK